MTLVVNQTYTPQQIANGNLYLAFELKERAISNKNRRSALECSTERHKLLKLIPQDFGLQVPASVGV